MSSDALSYGRGNSNYKIRPKRWRLTVIELLVVLGIILVLVSVLLPALCRSREGSNRIACASNMRQIGLGAIMWANDHGGNFPDDLDTILKTQDLSPQVFVCPSSKDTAPAGPTTQAVLEDMHQSGHLSYIYVGKGLTTRSDADVVVLYEQPSNHADDDMSATSVFKSGAKDHAMNVLCADGHIEWLGAEDAEAVRKQVADGVFPVKLPASK
jgi:type II secretory pathway pseudopilin PulG